MKTPFKVKFTGYDANTPAPPEDEAHKPGDILTVYHVESSRKGAILFVDEDKTDYVQENEVEMNAELDIAPYIAPKAPEQPESEIAPITDTEQKLLPSLAPLFKPHELDFGQVDRFLTDTESRVMVARLLLKRRDQDRLSLAKVLKCMKDNGDHLKFVDDDGNQLYGDIRSGFAQFCAAQLHMRHSETCSLVGTMERAELAGITEAQMSAVGASKLQAIVAVANKDNAKELVDFAERHNVPETREKVSEEATRLGFKNPGLENVRVRVGPAEAAMMREAIEIAAGMLQLDSKTNSGACMVYITQQWMSFCTAKSFNLEYAIKSLMSTHQLSEVQRMCHKLAQPEE